MPNQPPVPDRLLAEYLMAAVPVANWRSWWWSAHHLCSLRPASRGGGCACPTAVQ